MITVIMSTYREEENILREAIESIRNQTLTDWEFLIVLDDPGNAVHRTVCTEYAEKDNRIRVIGNPVNQGLASSLNTAVQEAQGEYIARMDADDIALPERLEKQLAYLQKHNLDLCGGLMQVISYKEKEIYSVQVQPANPETVTYCLRWGSCVPHPSWLGKKSFFLDLQGYRPLPFAQDYDVLVRAALAGKRMGNLNEPVLLYRMRQNSITRANVYNQYLLMRYLSREYTAGRVPQMDQIQSYLEKHFNVKKAARCSKGETIFYQALGLMQQKKIVSAVFTTAKLPFVSLAYTDKAYRFLRLHMASRRENR